jgi:hypothetical protein
LRVERERPAKSVHPAEEPGDDLKERSGHDEP